MRVTPEKLREATVHILKALNATDVEASIVADSLVQADMRGIDTHGVNLLTTLYERVNAGMLEIPTNVKVLKESDATALIDGANGLGQVAVHKAMTISVEKAKQFGLGCCLVRNTNNIGILSFYTLQAAREGMIGIVMSNAAPAISPWGGSEAFFGTNPLSVAIPGDADDPAIVLDMSSSVVARGKIRRAARLKEKIPEGWAFDKTGAITTDADKALEGTLAPIGGPKGYGLAMIVDILSGLLSGSKYGPGVITFHQLLGPTGVGVFTLAVDIGRFMDYRQFRDLIQPYFTAVKASKKAVGVSRIYLPGEIEFEKEKVSMKEGVEVNEGVVRNINLLLEKTQSSLRL